MTPTFPGVEGVETDGVMDDTADNTEDTDDKEEDIDDTEDTDDTEEDIDDTEDTDDIEDTNDIEDVMVGVTDKLAVGDLVDATYTVTHAKWKHVNFIIAVPKILQSLSTVMHGHKPELFRHSAVIDKFNRNSL